MMKKIFLGGALCAFVAGCGDSGISVINQTTEPHVPDTAVTYQFKAENGFVLSRSFDDGTTAVYTKTGDDTETLELKHAQRDDLHLKGSYRYYLGKTGFVPFTISNQATGKTCHELKKPKCSGTLLYATADATAPYANKLEIDYYSKVWNEWKRDKEFKKETKLIESWQK